jgi:hypothetical protein
MGKYSWSEIWGYNYGFWALVLVSSVVISAIRNKHNLNVKELELELTTIHKNIEIYKNEYYNLCSDNILNIFSEFYTTGNDRISIYKHQGNHFTLLGRYSENPNFNKPKQYIYKEDEGLIGSGWSNGKAYIYDAPKWSGAGTEYINFMKKRCEITKKRLKQISMHSRSIFVKTINDTTTATNPDGLIVFESNNPKKVQEVECNLLIEKHKEELIKLLKNMNNLTKKIK